MVFRVDEQGPSEGPHEDSQADVGRPLGGSGRLRGWGDGNLLLTGGAGEEAADSLALRLSTQLCPWREDFGNPGHGHRAGARKGCVCWGDCGRVQGVCGEGVRACGGGRVCGGVCGDGVQAPVCGGCAGVCVGRVCGHVCRGEGVQAHVW